MSVFLGHSAAVAIQTFGRLTLWPQLPARGICVSARNTRRSNCLLEDLLDCTKALLGEAAYACLTADQLLSANSRARAKGDELTKPGATMTRAFEGSQRWLNDAVARLPFRWRSIRGPLSRSQAPDL
jgi:hypothetical protein